VSRQLFLIHTVPALIATFEPLIRRHLPEWTPFNIADESLLKISIREGSLSKVTARRVAGYVFSAVDAGADAILVTCSSIGAAVDAVRPLCPVPLMRVDEGMAVRALALGDRIGILATLSTTLNPTRDLVSRLAATRATPPEIIARVCDGAFEALSAGDRDRHDRIVAEGIRTLSREVDVIVLAQASMARVLDAEGFATPAIPVLSSPELGVLRLRDALDGA
jgi:Asp/Glu/hydantoin racemase